MQLICLNPQVASAAASIPDPGLYSQALKVKDIPVFIWLDTLAKVPSLDTYLADTRAQQTATGKKLIVQLVLYNLPGRDCHATTSYGELSIANNGEALYKQFIDTIASIISKYPDVRVVIVFEPGSLPTLVTNLSDPRCANAAPVYRSLTVYALKKLYYCHVWVYLDAGHSRWLGWPANLPPAAQLFASIYNASLPNRVRGLSTNVGNYNPLVTTVPDPNIYLPDEIKYIEALAPLLTQNGFPAHFIVDTGRNGVDNIRDDWNNSCNIEGAGLGVRPTPSTGHPLIDAFVWIKPPGESDGTSDITSPRYDTTCGSADAKKPSLEAGQWFQAHFVDLVRNANPPL
ncbi:hypothetical protein FRC03_007984 [Tulasnella sp. 419]|nr:hypothetical protein FRC03_007984 [Tulasnella sp. 419]